MIYPELVSDAACVVFWAAGALLSCSIVSLAIKCFGRRWIRKTVLGFAIALASAATIGLTAFVVAFAGSPDYRHQPPSQYRHDTTVTMDIVDPNQVPGLCNALGVRSAQGSFALACTTGPIDHRVIVFPNPCLWPNGSDLRDLFCHEIGHANGWSADHPDN